MQWLETNKDYPYASYSEQLTLSHKTNLETKIIKRWFYNHRSKDLPGTYNRCFSKNDKIILKEFLLTKSSYPCPSDLLKLSQIIKKAEKKNQIMVWLSKKKIKTNRNRQLKNLLFKHLLHILLCNNYFQCNIFFFQVYNKLYSQ